MLNLDSFYLHLDAVRDAKRMTWKDVARESGVSPSTLTRMKGGARPDADGFAALIRWSGLDANTYCVELHDLGPLQGVVPYQEAEVTHERK